MHVVDSERKIAPLTHVAGVAELRSAGSEMQIAKRVVDVRAGLRVERGEREATVRVGGET